MARKAIWPPKPYPHKCGQDRLRWHGNDYWLGKTGSPEAAARLEAVLAQLEVLVGFAGLQDAHLV
ncbi:MAG: hypothetical protein V4466_14615 [Pseudomonadota bacterium]